MKHIQHPVFGELEQTHDVPDINMFWWQGTIAFPNTATSVELDIRATPDGPIAIQADAFGKLLLNHSELLASAARHDNSRTAPDKWQLEKVTIYTHGHFDLHFDADGDEVLIYADADAKYLTAEEAAEN